jgi:hypothetical protein
MSNYDRTVLLSIAIGCGVILPSKAADVKIASASGDRGNQVNFTLSLDSGQQFDPALVGLQDHKFRSAPGAGAADSADPECVTTRVLTRRSDLPCDKLDHKSTIPIKRQTTVAGNELTSSQDVPIDWVIFHVVIWDDSGNVSDSKWYLYDRQGRYPNRYFPFKAEGPSLTSSTRILGDSNVALIPIHFNLPNGCRVAYKVSATAKRAQNVQDLIDLVTAALTIVNPSKAPAPAKLNLWSGVVLSNLNTLPADWSVSVDTSSCSPKPKARASATQNAAPPAAPDQAAANQLYDNEGLHRWDVSIGMPVTSYKNVVYNADTGVVTPKANDKITPYAFFDLYPYRADIKKQDGGFVGFKFEFGIPIGNQPLNHPFMGGALNVSLLGIRFSPFAGIQYQKEFRPATLAPGSPSTPAALNNDLKSKRVSKLMIGLNFSVKDAVSLLKGTSSSK